MFQDANGSNLFCHIGNLIDRQRNIDYVNEFRCKFPIGMFRNILAPKRFPIPHLDSSLALSESEAVIRAIINYKILLLHLPQFRQHSLLQRPVDINARAVNFYSSTHTAPLLESAITKSVHVILWSHTHLHTLSSCDRCEVLKPLYSASRSLTEWGTASFSVFWYIGKLTSRTMPAPMQNLKVSNGKMRICITEVFCSLLGEH